VLTYAPMRRLSRFVTCAFLAPLFLCCFVACEQERQRPPISFPTDPPDLGFVDGGQSDELLLACLPGSRKCLDETSPIYEVCAPSGTYFELATCEPGQICRDKRCTPFVCQSSREICLSGETAATCADDGKSYINQRACTEDSVCRGGTCVDLCESARLEGSYIGCDYVAVRLPNLSEQSYAFAVVVGNPHRFLSVRVSLEMRDQSTPALALDTPRTSQIISQSGLESPITSAQNVTIPPGSMAVLVLDVPINEKIKISSSRPVVAAQFNPYCCNKNYSNDASLLFPTYTLGNRYRVTAYPAFDTVPSEVVAVMGDTPTTISWLEGGRTQDRDLQANETWTLRSFAPDLSGIELSANQPFTLFSSHSCTFIPDDLWACDHIESQLYPADSLGRQYLLTPTRIRSENITTSNEATFWRITADQDVRIRLSPGLQELETRPASNVHSKECADFVVDDEIRLQAGETCEFGSYQPTFASADGRYSVAGFISGHQSTGKRFYGTYAGDPSMFLLPPFDRLRSDYTFISPPTYQVSYVTLAAPANTPILLDGVSIEESRKLQIEKLRVNGQDWTVFALRVHSGVHRVESSRPFALLVYAYDDYVSYAYVGGLDLGPKE